MREHPKERVFDTLRRKPSIFIDNLHQATTKREIFDIVKGAQTIVDIFISRKKRLNNKCLFGFVRVHSEDDMKEICRRCNGVVHRGHRLFLNPARFTSKNSTQSHPTNLLPMSKQIHVENFTMSNPVRPFHKNGRLYSEVLKGEPQSASSQPRVIALSPVAFNVEWLKRSCIFLTKPNLSREQFASFLKDQNVFPSSLAEMGPCKFIATFSDFRLLEEVLKLEFPSDLVSLVKEWSTQDRCEVRRAWIEIIGLPLQLWDACNIRKIADHFGDVVRIHNGSLGNQSFSKALVLIDSLSLGTIDSSIIVQDNLESFNVRIKEVFAPSLFEIPVSMMGINKGVEQSVHAKVAMESVNEEVFPQERGCQVYPKATMSEHVTETKEGEEASSSDPNQIIPSVVPESATDVASSQGKGEKGGGETILVQEVQPAQEEIDSSLSDSSLPPGFEHNIPVEMKLKARERKRMAAKAMKKFLHRRRPDFTAKESRKQGKKKQLPAHLDSAEVLRFAKVLGLNVDGKEEEVQGKIDIMLREEKERWDLHMEQQTNQGASHETQ